MRLKDLHRLSAMYLDASKTPAGIVLHGAALLAAFAGPKVLGGMMTADHLAQALAGLPILGVMIWGLYRKLSDVEERLSPNIEIEFDDSGRDIFSSPPDENGSSMRVYRVAIRNTGNEHLTNCVISLEDLIDSAGRRPVFVPAGLQRQEGDGPFPLRVGQPKYAVVAMMDERTPGAPINIPQPGDRPPLILPRGLYRLLVEAYGTPGGKASRSLWIWVDGSGRLQMSLAEPMGIPHVSARSSLRATG